MTTISYYRQQQIDYNKLSYVLNDDFYSMRGRTQHDFENLVDLAKQLPDALRALSAGRATEEQQIIYNTFFAKRISLEQDENGMITIIDGRHRILAMQKAEIAIELPVRCVAHLTLIQDVQHFDTHNKSYAQNQMFVWLNGAVQDLQRMQQECPAATMAQDIRTNQPYLYIAASDIPEWEEFVDLISCSKNKQVFWEER